MLSPDDDRGALYSTLTPLMKLALPRGTFNTQIWPVFLLASNWKPLPRLEPQQSRTQKCFFSRGWYLQPQRALLERHANLLDVRLRLLLRRGWKEGWKERVSPISGTNLEIRM